MQLSSKLLFTICSNIEDGLIVSICGLSSNRGSSCLVRHIV